MHSGPLWTLERMFLTWVYYSGLFIEGFGKLLVLSGTQKKRRLWNRSRLLYKLICHLGHVLQLIQWCLKF